MERPSDASRPNAPPPGQPFTEITMRAHINGIDMHYAVDGPNSAPVVVLHHPLATNLSFWDEATVALAPTYRVVRYDARGHGATEAPLAPYDFSTLAQDCVALMDHLGIARANVVGLSMGGMVAQFLALDHASRFSSACIVASTSRIPETAKPLWSDRVAVARAQGMASQSEPALQRWLAAASRANRPDLTTRCKAMIEATPLEGYAGWCAAIESLDMTDRLSGIALPVCIIAGAEDIGTPPAVSETMHERIAGSELTVIPGVAHMLAIENPAAFHAALMPFLSRHAV